MTIDTKELRRLAQAATPGGWYVEHGNYVYGCKDVIDGEEEWHPIIACTDDGEPGNFAGNAAFIAAANPAVISELLDRLEAAEKDAAELEARCATLADALRSTAQTLSWMQHGKCRGFSDDLLTTNEALEKARAALEESK